MLYIYGNSSWKAESLCAESRDIYSLTGDLCDNNDATCSVLPRLGLDVTSASFELQRGVSEAEQRTCVTAIMWNLKSEFYACQECELMFVFRHIGSCVRHYCESILNGLALWTPYVWVYEVQLCRQVKNVHHRSGTGFLFFKKCISTDTFILQGLCRILP